MGNSTSHANPPRPPNVQRRPESSLPSPATSTNTNTDPSLRTKKRSLELPDLASLSLGSGSRTRYQTIPTKSASIPIPVSTYNTTIIPGEAGRIRAPITLPSTADVLTTVTETTSTNRPFPPPLQRPPSAPRQPDARQVAAQQRIQELYNQFQTPSPPPQAPSAFVPEIVHSSIPAGLMNFDNRPAPNVTDIEPEPISVTITWRGGGKIVQLARAGDDDWKGRLQMDRE